MKDAIRSLAIVIFGGYTLYLAYIWLDEEMAEYPRMFLTKAGYIELFISAIITLILFWSILRDQRNERWQHESTLTSDIPQSTIEEKI